MTGQAISNAPLQWKLFIRKRTSAAPRWCLSRRTPLWALWAWEGLPAETRMKSAHVLAWRESRTDAQLSITEVRSL
jgi:hypothetical protein